MRAGMKLKCDNCHRKLARTSVDGVPGRKAYYCDECLRRSGTAGRVGYTFYVSLLGFDSSGKPLS